jgi:hypothetical protein
VGTLSNIQRLRKGLWAFVANSKICIAQTHAVACTPEHQALTSGVMLGTFKPPRHRQGASSFLVQGLVPNGVTEVLIKVGHRLVHVEAMLNSFSAAANHPLLVAKLVRHR